MAEVFLVAWRRFTEVPSEAALAWLYRVARYVLANEVRERRRWRDLTLRIAAEHDWLVETDHVDGVIGRRDVAVAFNRLPTADREVFLVGQDHCGTMLGWKAIQDREPISPCGMRSPLSKSI